MTKYKYEIIDNKNLAERVGQVVYEDKAYVAARPKPVQGGKRIEDLAVGESTLRVGYHGVYRVTREE